MEESNQLATVQEKIGKELQQLLTNIKKDSSVRKTESYLRKREEKIEELWTAAEDNNNELINLNVREHNYFKTKYFDQMKEVYLHLKMVIKECWKKLSNEEMEISTNQSLRLKEQGVRMLELEETMDEIKGELEHQRSTSRYNQYITDITKQFQDIADLHIQIKVNETEFTNSYFTARKFQTLKTKFNNIMEELNQKITNNHDNTSNMNIKLPSIQVPNFYGKYEEWSTFQDIFTKTIDNNTKLSNVEKFQYLKSFIKGDAAKVIQHFQISEINYTSAWNQLKERYNNKRLIVKKLINKLLDIPTSKFESAEKLKNIYSITKECTEAIKLLGIDTQSWGPIIVCIITRKLDEKTNELNELSINNPMELQSLEDLLSFLLKRFQSLEAITENLGHQNKLHQKSEKWSHKEIPETEKKQNCKYCKENHLLYQCQKFKAISVNQRLEFIKERKLCFNCFNHDFKIKCKSSNKCRTCQKGHHTLLHKENELKKENHDKRVEEKNKPSTSQNIYHSTKNNETVLLATALIKVKGQNNEFLTLRALIDSGSQASFITEEAAELLNLPKQHIKAEISGLGDSDSTKCKFKVDAIYKAREKSEFSKWTELLVLSKLTKKLPEKEVCSNSSEWKNFILADPYYNKPGRVDIILGANDYKEIILDGIKRNDGLVGQNTELGWIIYGSANNNANEETIKILSMVTRTEEKNDISKYWEMEEVSMSTAFGQDELLAEDIYEKTTNRDTTNGKFTVQIPFKQGQNIQLGESRSRSLARLFQLEKRLNNNKKLREDYNKFMREYIELGHMEKVPQKDHKLGKYYIPHQAVIRECSSTTKLRVVFDASCKSSNGVSLNNIMYSGPRLQQELIEILIRWRTHKIALSADIEKMYRQIILSEADRDYHRILWRFSDENPIDEYKLTTVTYGTTAAPYLAVKTILTLAQQEKENFPLASEIACRDFYVDDLLSGADNEQDAYKLQNELIAMFKAGGFTLRKWNSNKKVLLQNLSPDLRDENALEIKQDELKKSLGIHWAPQTDTIRFKLSHSMNKVITKRTILSETARLFDPIGWLAPVLINAKMLIQDLWLQNLKWDEPVSENISKKWLKFQNQLKTLEDINIPRWIQYRKDQDVELHGFCDASEKAYGAAVYMKVTNDNKIANISLLAAKSKVAPARTKITLPRLELCSAHLLSKLMKKVTNSLSINKIKIYCWSDSKITLAWIQGQPSRWKTFVANRVAEIQQLVPANHWHHVQSSDNPADAISRGVEPNKLKELKLWWNGPKILTESNYGNTNEKFDVHNNEERSILCYKNVVTNSQEENDICERFSSLTKMIRVITYCRRFINKCRKINTDICGPLLVNELNNSLKHIIKLQQKRSFASEIKQINEQNKIEKSNNLLSLHPFIDSEGILRVGGRLQNALMEYDNKHPIILPLKCHLSSLIIKNAHLITLHGGVQQTLAYVRRKFWILQCKKSVKGTINKCIICIRHRAQTSQQLMGALPSARVTPSPPFTHTGVDYAGPIKIRTAKGRGQKSYKGYISIFVCFATKAIHLEVVSDMTSETFLAALKRFMARRGTVSHIYSDNGTTFVGAKNMIEQEVIKLITNNVQNQMSTMGVQWHFIPAAAPHFGGLWEAGVKSTKHHLRRVVGNATLTYEELSTLLQQIEACLNSRPLCSLTEEINQTTILTPGHFLIGREILSPNNLNSEKLDNDIELPDRWKLIHKMKKDFWNAWSTEYLTNLQQRNKWKYEKDNIRKGDVVILKEENINPNKWPLARIQETHPDNCGLNRVVTLKTANGNITKRPIHKLIPLPVNDNFNIKKEEINEKHKNKNKPRSISFKSIILAILFITSLNQITVSAEPYQIQYLSPGFYVEHLGHSIIERGRFRIEIKISKSKIENDTASVYNVTKQMESFCNSAKEISENVECPSLINHLKQQEKQLTWIKKGLEKAIQRRNKRGLLGKFMTSVFGVNEEVYNDIDNLQDNQKRLIEASNQQTKFMLQALSQFNDTDIRITNKFNDFQKKLKSGLEMIENMDGWYVIVDRNKVALHVLSTYQLAESYLDQLMTYYRSLLHMHIDNANLYEIVSPTQIDEIIETYSKKLPSNIQILPYPILKTSVEHSKLYIHIFGYFLMVEKTEFSLIKVTAVPQKIENGFYWSIDVSYQIIAIDYNAQRYFQISYEDLKESIQIDKNLIVCSPSILRNIENSPNCVIDQIYKKARNTTCEVVKHPIKSTVWKELYSKRSWLFITPAEAEIAFICNGEREEITINGTGVIKISPDCIISTKKTVLTPKKEDEVVVVGQFFKPVVANLTMSKIFIPSMELPEEVIKPFGNLEDLKSKEENLNKQMETTIWKSISHPNTYVNTFLTSLMLILVFTVFYLINTYIKTRREAKRQPTSSNVMEMEPLQIPSINSQQERHYSIPRGENGDDHSGGQNVQLPEQ